MFGSDHADSCDDESHDGNDDGGSDDDGSDNGGDNGSDDYNHVFANVQFGGCSIDRAAC